MNTTTFVWRFGRRLPDVEPLDRREDWKQANPRWIRRALEHSQQRSAGGWYVVDASRRISDKPRRVTVTGHRLVVWRTAAGLFAAPDACPHMGASLSEGCVRRGRLVCPWHGLALGPEGHGGWKPLATHDDGVLLWVRIEGPETPTEAPIIAPRPERFVDGVIRVEARCEPRDVVQNRLDPWHGVHFHPQSFARLQLIDRGEDELTVRVAYRVLGPLAVEVDARFHCPDRRTIVMTIVRGDGEGSVVETHATPIGPGRTAIIEATLATSDRRAFAVACAGARLLRPLIERAAHGLWRQDAAYAERLYECRHLQVRH